MMSELIHRIKISSDIVTLEDGSHLFYEPLGMVGHDILYLVFSCSKGADIAKVEVEKTKDSPTFYFLSAFGRRFEFEGKPISEEHEKLKQVLHIPDVTTVERWRKGELLIPSNKELWLLVKNYYDTFGDYEERFHPTIMSLATFQTCLLPLLETVFYLTIDGDYGAGKTTILTASQETAYHAFMGDSVSAPFRARYVSRYNATLYQDEIDSTEDEDGIGLALARTSYRRGAFFGRWNAEKDEPDLISHFGPLNYTLHEDPKDNAFMSRSLAKITVSKSTDFQLPIINNLRRNVSQDIADLLFFWRLNAIDEAFHDGYSMHHVGIDLADWMSESFDRNKKRTDLYDIATKNLTEREKVVLTKVFGRENELAYVVLLIERILGVDVISDLVDAINIKIAEDRVPMDEVQVMFYEILTAKFKGNQESFRLRECTEELERRCKESTRKAPQTQTISTWLRDIGFRPDKTKKKVGGNVYLYPDDAIRQKLEGRGAAQPIEKKSLFQEKLLGQDNQDNQDNNRQSGGQGQEDNPRGVPQEAKDYHDYPDYHGKPGICSVCQKQGGKIHNGTDAAFYLHPECEEKWEGKL